MCCSLAPFEGEMEIACNVIVKVRATHANTKLVEKYMELVKEKYSDQKPEEILGCFITNLEE